MRYTGTGSARVGAKIDRQCFIMWKCALCQSGKTNAHESYERTVRYDLCHDNWRVSQPHKHEVANRKA